MNILYIYRSIYWNINLFDKKIHKVNCTMCKKCIQKQVTRMYNKKLDEGMVLSDTCQAMVDIVPHRILNITNILWQYRNGICIETHLYNNIIFFEKYTSCCYIYDYIW